MRVMADTNILISALLFPTSLPAKVLLHIANGHDLVLCDHIVAELRDVIARKRPDFQVPGKLIQDPKDQPILNAAIMADVDVIVSGDKHFLKLDLDRPQTMSPAQFWNLEQGC